jgi:hypothetical protein
MIVDSFRLMTGSTRRLGAAICGCASGSSSQRLRFMGDPTAWEGTCSPVVSAGGKTFFMPGDIADAGFC